MKEQTSDHLFASIIFFISVLINIKMVGVIIMLSMIMHFLIDLHHKNKKSTEIAKDMEDYYARTDGKGGTK